MVHQVGAEPRRGALVLGVVRKRAARWRARLRVLGIALACVLVGAVLGWASTVVAERHAASIGAVHLGLWTFSPDAGTANLNPYLRARFADTGQIPIPAGIGFTLLTNRDSTGARLDRQCAYRISGSMPRTRFWSLEAATNDGFPLANPAGRAAFTSRDVIREAGAPLSITASPAAMPGNWLPLSGTGRLVLVLRLYEPSISMSGRDTIRSLAVPSVERLSCG